MYIYIQQMSSFTSSLEFLKFPAFFQGTSSKACRIFSMGMIPRGHDVRSGKATINAKFMRS